MNTRRRVWGGFMRPNGDAAQAVTRRYVGQIGTNVLGFLEPTSPEIEVWCVSFVALVVFFVCVRVFFV